MRPSMLRTGPLKHWSRGGAFPSTLCFDEYRETEADDCFPTSRFHSRKPDSVLEIPNNRKTIELMGCLAFLCPS